MTMANDDSKSKTYDTYTQTESWLIQRLPGTAFGLGTTKGLVPLESGQLSAHKDHTGRSAARPYEEHATFQELDVEEARLIHLAKKGGFFIENERLKPTLEQLEEKTTRGSEHDVYLLQSNGGAVIIRNTIRDSYGFVHRSPAQYLKRLEDYNQLFPGIQIRVIGVSGNMRGNGVIWTIQPFVEGREFPNDAALRKALCSRGWDHVKDITFIHKHTGIVIEDAHCGNVLERDDQLYPIDVIVKHPPLDQTCK